MRPRLFVGSAGEQLHVARAVQAELEEVAEVTVWNQGVLELTKSTLESLLKELTSTDFAVFIFTPEDAATIRADEKRVVRDNVLFELGIALGALGTDRSFILRPNRVELDLPSDLLGITAATYDANRTDGRLRSAVSTACDLISQAIQSVGSRGAPASIVTVRAGISGAMSVGKKTLATALTNKLNQQPYIDQVVTYQDVGRQLIKAGRTADRKTQFADYAAYFQRHLKNLNGQPAGCMLYVRTVFDTIAYAEVNGNFAGEWMAMARELARLCAEKFHVYFYVPVEPDVPIVNDGVRSTDRAYRNKIDGAIHRVLREFFPRYVEVRGTVDQRVETALSEIDRICRPVGC